LWHYESCAFPSFNVGESHLLWGGFFKLLLNFWKSSKTYQNMRITLFD